MKGITRRDFIKTSGVVAGTVAGILSANNVMAIDLSTPVNEPGAIVSEALMSDPGYGIRTIWLSPTEYVTGDPTLLISYPSVSHPSTIVTSKIKGDLKWISMGLPLPSNIEIKEVTVCYQVSNPRSFISQVRLVEMNTPDKGIVRHDDSTDLKSISPVCYRSTVPGFVPTSAVTLELRLNYQDPSDKITLGAVGINFRTTTIIPGDSTDMIQSLLNAGGDVHLAAGVYTITRPLTIPPRTRLRGDGSRTILRCDPQLLPDGPTVWLSNAPATEGTDGQIEIIDLALELASPRPEQTGLHLGVGSTNPRSCRVAGVELSGMTRHGIRLDRAWASVIDGCTMLGMHSNAADAWAIMLADGANGVAIRNCYFSNCDAHIRASNFGGLSIESNVFDGGGRPESQEHIWCSGGRGLTISSNYVEALRTATGQYAIRLRDIRGAEISGNMLVGDYGGEILTWGMLWIDTGCTAVRVSGNCIEGVKRALTSLSPDTHVFVAPEVLALIEGNYVLE